MAQWWENLTGGEPPQGGTFGQYINYGLKAVPQATSPKNWAKGAIDGIFSLNTGLAAYRSGLPDSIIENATNLIVGGDAGKAGEMLAVFGIVSAVGALSAPKPPSAASEAQKIYNDQIYGNNANPTGSGQEENNLNEGYEAKTTVKLGSLEFEVPPAMATVTSVHGGMGSVAPGAGNGISVRHVQNVSTMLIPGSVPLYQSLGIQGQMVEFVGAFLGFNSSAYHDASKHMTEEESQTEEKNYHSEGSPDPFYKAGEGQFSGDDYSAEKKNLGSWAVSRAFEMHIRSGQPMPLEVKTPVLTISYMVLIAGFDRVYQRDDRTWYKIQAMVVGSAEGGTVFHGRQTVTIDPAHKGGRHRRGGGGNKGRGGKRTSARPKGESTGTTKSRNLGEAQKLAQKIDEQIKKFSAKLDDRIWHLNYLLQNLYDIHVFRSNTVNLTSYSNLVTEFRAYTKLFKSEVRAIEEKIAKVKELDSGIATTLKMYLADAISGTLPTKYKVGNNQNLRTVVTDKSIKKGLLSDLKKYLAGNLDPIDDYDKVVKRIEADK